MRYRSLRRVLPYLRAYRRALVVIAIASAFGLAAAVAIPLVTEQVIDGPLADGDEQGSVTLAALALGLGVVEACAALVRRYLLGITAHGVETDLRDDLYAHLQRLDVGFHDDWESGQLLSRATSDISAIRRFVGWGAVFFVINGVTAIVVFVLLFRIDAQLALLVMALAVPLALILRVVQRRYSAASRKIQDDQGDLATLVEEGATGIRAIKSFGRAPFVSRRFDAQSRVLHDASMERVRIIIHFEWVLNVLPGIALGGGDVPGRRRGRRRRDDRRRPGRVHQLPAHGHLAGRVARLDPRDGRGGGDRRPAGVRGVRRRPERAGPGRTPRRASTSSSWATSTAACASRASAFAYPEAPAAGPPRRGPRDRARRDARARRAHRRGQDHAGDARAPPLRRDATGASPSTASTCAT